MEERTIFGNTSRKNDFDYLDNVSKLPVTPQASIRRPSDRRITSKTVSFIQKNESHGKEEQRTKEKVNSTNLSSSDFDSVYTSPISNLSQTTYRSRIIDQSSVMREISEPSPLKFTSEYGKSSYMGPIPENSNDDSYFSQKSLSEQAFELPSASLFSSSAPSSRILENSSENSDSLLEEDSRDTETETEIKSELDILREEIECLRRENELLKKEQPATNEHLKKEIKRIGDAILPKANRHNVPINSVCSDAGVLEQYVNDIIDAHNALVNECQKNSAVTQLATTVIETISKYEQDLDEQHQALLSLFNKKSIRKPPAHYSEIFS